MGTAALKRLVGPIGLTTTDTTVYTVPVGFKTIIRGVHATADFQQTKVVISVGPDSPTSRFFAAQIDANNQAPVVNSTGIAYPLSAGETVNASLLTGTGSLTLVGEEIPV